MNGPLWLDLMQRPRYAARTLSAWNIPEVPGVYAWFEEGRPVYVGKAEVLRARLWRQHLSQGRSLGNSALRRNVAEDLGYGSAAAIKAKLCVLTIEQLHAIRERLLACEIVWIECVTKADACNLEDRIKAEWRPPLTKR